MHWPDPRRVVYTLRNRELVPAYLTLEKDEGGGVELAAPEVKQRGRPRKVLTVTKAVKATPDDEMTLDADDDLSEFVIEEN